MGSKLKYLLFSFLLVLVFSSAAYSDTSIQKTISSSSDDAFDNSSNTIYLTSSVLSVGDTSYAKMIGLRFGTITIPHNAKIISATIDFKKYGTVTDECNSTIQAHLKPNAGSFTASYSNTIRHRSPLTSASVPWSIPTTLYSTTPNFAAVVQEVVNQSNWESGNYIVIIIKPVNNNQALRKFYSYDYNNAKYPATLKIVYGAVQVSPPTISVSPPSNIANDTVVNTNASPRFFTLKNSGDSTLNYEIGEDSDWFSCTPTNGNLNAGASTQIILNYNTSGLSIGDHVAPITITDRDVDDNGTATLYDYQALVRINPVPTASICGDVPVYTENLVNPAILLLLDVSKSMAWDAPLAANSTVKHRTPDLTAIVDEIIDSDGWAVGGNMAFIFDGGYSGGNRTAVSYDASPDQAPLLHVDYTSVDDSFSIEMRIDQSVDDTDEEKHSHGQNFDGRDLKLGKDYLTGLRFRNLEIPTGVTIDSAYIEFSVDESGDAAETLNIAGEALDPSDPPAPSDPPKPFNEKLPVNRDTTTASVTWGPLSDPPLLAWDAPAKKSRLKIGQDVLSALVKDQSVAWGFGSWTDKNLESNNYTNIHVGTKPHSLAQEQDLLTKIGATVAAGNTPLIPSLFAAKDYFTGARADEASSETYDNLVCQPKMVIEITDGIGNTTREGQTDSVGTAIGSLADQKVTVVGVGFAIGNAVQLDELAAVSNARGGEFGNDDIYALHKELPNEDGDSVAQPFIANSKVELIDALNDITSSLKGEIFHGSAPAPTTSVDYGNIVITAQFSALNWSGDLIANVYNAGTGALGSANWSASDEMPDVISAFTLDGDGKITPYSDTSYEKFYLCKSLGDIINSTPIIVEGPAFNYSFNDYNTFKYQKINREKRVYVGANDGALHAFGLTDGVEKWRFYPKSLQAHLNINLVGGSQDLCFDEYCHKYLVDGSPVAADVFDGSSWHTILVTGLGHGGSSYFALDVSGSGVFDSGADAASYLWEFTNSDLGFATSEPAVSRVSDNVWAVFFGSGYPAPATATTEAYLFGLHALDRSPLWENGSGTPISKVKMATGTLLNDALSSPLVVDVGDDDIDDHIYTGNLYGSMYRVTDIGAGVTPTISRLFDFGRTTHENPLRAKAAFAYDETDENVWIYFGSGKYETSEDKATSTQQYFLGLKDNETLKTTSAVGKATYFWNAEDDAIGTSTKPINVITANEITDEDTQISYRTIDGCTGTDGSWLIKLIADTEGDVSERDASERVVSEPMVAGGVVFFTTFIPDENVCAGNGDAWLYAVNYKTGCAATGSDSVFDINGDGFFNDNDKVDGHTIVGVYIGSGQPSKPVLEGNVVFTTTTGGGLNATKVNIPSSLELKSWRHL